MRVLISIVVAIFIPELVHGAIDHNPYKKALLARPWESVQNYVTVRPGVHMFYWLYYADGTRADASCKPLIIWLQGGPGLAASGIGNFAEIGPLNMNMEPRNHTWVKGKNVLLIDYPAGTGFSYVRNDILLARTDSEVVNDVFVVIKTFLQRHKKFRTTPTYLFGQHYGGKICPMLALFLHTVIEEKSLKMDFQGIGIGSGWVNPKESILALPKVLYNRYYIDQSTYYLASTVARQVGNYINYGEYEAAVHVVAALNKYLLENALKPLNLYNIKDISPLPAMDLLQRKINTYVLPMLAHAVDQNFKWNHTSEKVFMSLIYDYLQSSSLSLESILNGTKLKVAVYSGNLDTVTSVNGTVSWLTKLNWPGSEEFKQAPILKMPGNDTGTYKVAKQLSYWRVYKAGHWVEADNPEGMEQILKYLIPDTAS